MPSGKNKRKDGEMARFDLRAAPSLFREDGSICCSISFCPRLLARSNIAVENNGELIKKLYGLSKECHFCLRVFTVLLSFLIQLFNKHKTNPSNQLK